MQGASATAWANKVATCLRSVLRRRLQPARPASLLHWPSLPPAALACSQRMHTLCLIAWCAPMPPGLKCCSNSFALHEAEAATPKYCMHELQVERHQVRPAFELAADAAAAPALSSSSYELPIGNQARFTSSFERRACMHRPSFPIGRSHAAFVGMQLKACSKMLAPLA